MKPRIIVEISGGVCVAVYASEDVSVSVCDWDNARMGDDTDTSLCNRLKAEADGLTQVL